MKETSQIMLVAGTIRTCCSLTTRGHPHHLNIFLYMENSNKCAIFHLSDIRYKTMWLMNCALTNMCLLHFRYLLVLERRQLHLAKCFSPKRAFFSCKKVQTKSNLFCTFLQLGAETFCQVKLSTTCLTLKNQQIPIYRRGNESPLYHYFTSPEAYLTCNCRGMRVPVPLFIWQWTALPLMQH